MSRVIQIDNNKYIGYSYIAKSYYVYNKGTQAFRSTPAQAKQILDIVAPDNTVTLVQIKELEDTYETLKSLSYTIYDTGAYVSSIQINDYENYPIVLNGDKQVLYILNTDIVFNLTINESKDTRITILKNFYIDTLGLELTREEITLIYDYLLSMYTPYVYNAIQDTTNTPITYSNIFALSNFSNTSRAEYICTTNPNNKYTETSIGDIVEAEASNNTLYILNPSSYISTLKAGDNIKVTGTTVDTGTYTYSADGEYIIANINTSTTPITITTTTALSSSYTFPYPKAYIQLAISTIESISRENNTVTLTSDVSDLITEGDIIEVQGTQEEIEGTTISCNGIYTVSAVQENIITVQNTLPTNYTYTTQEAQATLSKNMYIGNVNTVVTIGSATTINLMADSTVTLSPLQHVYIEETEDQRTYYTIQSVTSQQSIACVVSSYTGTPIYTYSPTYPQLQTQTPSTEILIEVTETMDNEVFPTGFFTVDNFDQCKQYIQTYSGLQVPSDAVYERVGKEVGGDVYISVGVLPVCKYLGIYSDIYEQDKK